MKITPRETHGFIELKVDELETTIFKSDNREIYIMIENLEDIIERLKTYIEHIKQLWSQSCLKMEYNKKPNIMTIEVNYADIIFEVKGNYVKAEEETDSKAGLENVKISIQGVDVYQILSQEQFDSIVDLALGIIGQPK